MMNQASVRLEQTGNEAVMDKDEVYSVFKEVFQIVNGADHSQILYNTFPGWDSVGHMSLVAALESHFGIMLEVEDILAMSSFEKAVEIVGRYQ